MSYSTNRSTRKRALDSLRKQMAAKEASKFLEGSNFSNWDEAFKMLNAKFFSDKLVVIPVRTSHKKKSNSYGIFCRRPSGDFIELNLAQGLMREQVLGVLLHEMCHHSISLKFGGHGYNANAGKRILGHGKEWKAEMRRVGYTGKVTKYTGKDRFLNELV